MTTLLKRLKPQIKEGFSLEAYRQGQTSFDNFVDSLKRTIDIERLIAIADEAKKRFNESPVESDAWLSPRIHAALRLYRSEAADLGIWMYLAFAVPELCDYIIWRWGGPDKDDYKERIIGNRHHALGRLWWVAELSRNGSDYSLVTDAFQWQDAVNYITDVNAFQNRPAALAYIRFLGRINDGQRAKKNQVVSISKALNHVLTTTILDVLAPDPGYNIEAINQWIQQEPDETLMFKDLPIGPDEPRVPEERITAVEELLQRIYSQMTDIKPSE